MATTSTISVAAPMMNRAPRRQQVDKAHHGQDDDQGDRDVAELVKAKRVFREVTAQQQCRRGRDRLSLFPRQRERGRRELLRAQQDTQQRRAAHDDPRRGRQPHSHAQRQDECDDQRRPEELQLRQRERQRERAHCGARPRSHRLCYQCHGRRVRHDHRQMACHDFGVHPWIEQCERSHRVCRELGSAHRCGELSRCEQHAQRDAEHKRDERWERAEQRADRRQHGDQQVVVHEQVHAADALLAPAADRVQKRVVVVRPVPIVPQRRHAVAADDEGEIQRENARNREPPELRQSGIRHHWTRSRLANSLRAESLRDPFP